MIQKKKRRGKWSVELHWMVLEVVSSHAARNIMIEPQKLVLRQNTGWYMEKNTQHINVGTFAASKSSYSLIFQSRYASFEFRATLGQ